MRHDTPSVGLASVSVGAGAATVRRRTATFAALAVTALAGLVGGTAAPAAAAACSPAKTTSPIAETPWPQRIWDLSRLPSRSNGSGQVVAVIDSGVDTTHPQLRNTVEAGLDLIDSGDGTRDCVGHGTAVASLIAARKVNGIGFHGLAPEADLLSVRASEQLGENNGEAASPAEVAGAIDWAVQQGATVINLSFSYSSEAGLDSLRAAIENAVAKDVVVVAAAGNKFDAKNPPSYPAGWSNVLGVGAVSQDGQRQALSQTGDFVDLMAPGDGVTAAALGGGHQTVTGTSYAAPLVAATAALVRQKFPRMTEAEVRRRLIATADPAPGGKDSKGYGAGIVNPVRAVTDVVAIGEVLAEAPPMPAGPDAAEMDAQRRAAESREKALWAAGAGAVVAAVVFTLASAMPSARRRRWAAGG